MQSGEIEGVKHLHCEVSNIFISGTNEEEEEGTNEEQEEDKGGDDGAATEVILVCSVVSV